MAGLDRELAETARSLILPGFWNRESIVSALVDSYELDADDPRPAQIVDEIWQARLQEQRNWHTPSDYHRLVDAFNKLTPQGFVCRMNFTCCQNCGTTEIDDERTLLDPPPPEGQYPWREWAYTFFHQQDADRLDESPAVLHLTYSAWKVAPGIDPELISQAVEDPRAFAELYRQTDRYVGSQVADALRNEGLDVAWDGDPGKRVQIKITDWRKPLAP